MTAFTLKAAVVQQGLFIASSYERRPPPTPVADKRQADMFGGTVTTKTATKPLVKMTDVEIMNERARLEAVSRDQDALVRAFAYTEMVRVDAEVDARKAIGLWMKGWIP